MMEEIDQLLRDVDAFVAGGQSETMVIAAEAKLGVALPPSFREYLLKWGNLSFGSYEYYGLTCNGDFENASVPNCVWFTLKKRIEVGLPHHLVVFRNINDDLYICIDADHILDEDEGSIAVWDNADRTVSETLAVTFADYLHDELAEFKAGIREE